jgi:inner membrane protein
MDNVCHTLVGAAFGEAGLKRHTRFGSATLMIAANLPDVDVLVFATDVPSVAFRRGWTHGILAQALLPLALAGLVFAVDRWWPARRNPDVTRSTSPPRASMHALVMLSYVGVLSHVFLDYLNNYGVRLLMPFSGEWFYGDALFIIDPWLWLTLGAGILLARTNRRWGFSAARVSLVIAAAYVAAMLVSAHAARIFVQETWSADRGRDPRALMVGPLPVTPLRRLVIVDAGDHYETGELSWFPRRVTFDPDVVPKRDEAPSVLVARNMDPRMRGILVWSRFPFYVVDPAPGGVRVTLRDMRFSLMGRGGFAATVFVPASHDGSEDK